MLTAETTDEACALLRAGRPAAPVVVAFRPESIVNNARVLAALAPPPEAATTPFDFAVKEYQVHRTPVGFFFIDEAHCGLSWGQTFIQEWARLGLVTQALSGWTCGRCPVQMMTATATPDAREYLKALYGFHTDAARVHEEVHSPRRSNVDIRFHASNAVDGGTAVQKRMSRLKRNICDGEVVLVFVNTLREAETVQQSIQLMLDTDMNANGVQLHAEYYHGDVPPLRQAMHREKFAAVAVQSAAVRAGLQRDQTLDPNWNVNNATQRRQRAAKWGQEERVVVLVATVAFGMGVDLDGLNRVMLWKTPRCLTDLVQQMLRGGRNPRRRCEVDVYVAWNEVLSHLTQARSLAAGNLDVGPRLAGDADAAVAVQRRDVLARAGQLAEEDLHAVQVLAHNAGECRWAQIDQVFGFAGTNPCGNACDVCRSAVAATTVPLVAETLGVEERIAQTFQPHTVPGSGFDLADAIKAVLRGAGQPGKSTQVKQHVSQRLRQLFREKRLKIHRREGVGEKWKFYGLI